MILTEDKIYTMSLETESVNRDSGLTNNTIELEFTNQRVITCNCYLWNADPETDSCISGEETF